MARPSTQALRHLRAGLWGVVVFGILCASGPQSVAVSSGLPVRINVYADADTGTMPFLFRAGMFSFSSRPPAYVQRKFFKDLKPGIMEIGIGNLVLNASSDFHDMTTRLAQLDAFVLEAARHGAEVVIAIGWMPTWLSANPGDQSSLPYDKTVTIANLSPPKDYTEWARLVEAVVRHYKYDLKLDLRYKIWWEPDIEYWQGTEDEFFTLYRYSVLGARRADAAARIGGPSVTGVLAPHWRERERPSRLPMLYKFLQYCAHTPLPELRLSRLPIDFVVWHQFGANPLSGYAASAALVRRWLTQFGYPTDTVLLLGEWSSWEAFPQPLSREHDQPYLAAYVVASLIGMHDAGIQRHAFTSLVEQHIKKDTEFAGGFGIVTKNFIVKPVFNAFKALSRLGERRIRVDDQDPFIGVIAGRGHDTVSVVVSNYVPLPRMLKQMPGERLVEHGYRPRDLMQHLGFDPHTAEELLAGRKQVDELGLPSDLDTEVRAALQEYRALSTLTRQRSHKTTPVTLTIQGLPFASAFWYEYYAIDSAHGNSYAVRQKIDRLLADVRTPEGIARSVQQYIPAGIHAETDAATLGALVREPAKAQERLAHMEPADRERLAWMATTISCRILDEINQWPEVVLAKVSAKRVVPSSRFTVTLHLEPYAVGLVVLRGTHGK